MISLARRQNEPLLTKVLEKSSNEIRFTLIEAFLSAQTNAPVNAVYKYLDQAMTGKNKVEIIEKVLLSSAFVPRPSEFLTEKILVKQRKFFSSIELESFRFVFLRRSGTNVEIRRHRSTFGTELFSRARRHRPSNRGSQSEIDGKFAQKVNRIARSEIDFLNKNSFWKNSPNYSKAERKNHSFIYRFTTRS